MNTAQTRPAQTAGAETDWTLSSLVPCTTYVLVGLTILYTVRGPRNSLSR